MPEVLAQVGLAGAAGGTAAASAASRPAAGFSAAIGLIAAAVVVFLRRRGGQVFKADRQREMLLERLCEFVRLAVHSNKLNNCQSAVEHHIGVEDLQCQ